MSVECLRKHAVLLWMMDSYIGPTSKWCGRPRTSMDPRDKISNEFCSSGVGGAFSWYFMTMGRDVSFHGVLHGGLHNIPHRSLRAGGGWCCSRLHRDAAGCGCRAHKIGLSAGYLPSSHRETYREIPYVLV